jgi:hypothetical protein
MDQETETVHETCLETGLETEIISETETILEIF